MTLNLSDRQGSLWHQEIRKSLPFPFQHWLRGRPRGISRIRPITKWPNLYSNQISHLAVFFRIFLFNEKVKKGSISGCKISQKIKIFFISIPNIINLPSPTSSGDFSHFLSFKTNAAGRRWGQINFLGNAYLNPLSDWLSNHWNKLTDIFRICVDKLQMVFIMIGLLIIQWKSWKRSLATAWHDFLYISRLW